LRFSLYECDTAEVVSVKVGNQNQVDRVRIDAQSLQTDQRSYSALDQNSRRAAVDIKTSLQSTPAAEGVTAANNGDSRHEKSTPILETSEQQTQ
jgi:hypothetical protein